MLPLVQQQQGCRYDKAPARFLRHLSAFSHPSLIVPVAGVITLAHYCMRFPCTRRLSKNYSFSGFRLRSAISKFHQLKRVTNKFQFIIRLIVTNRALYYGLLAIQLTCTNHIVQLSRLFLIQICKAQKQTPCILFQRDRFQVTILPTRHGPHELLCWQ